MSGTEKKITKKKRPQNLKISFKHGEDAKITGQQKLLLLPLTNFYKKKENNSIFKNVVINCNSRISLRLIDWFVTNYSKKNNIIYNPKKYLNKKLETENYEDYFNVFNSYKCQLKSYSKKNFDPFCRNQRITFFYDGDDYVETTIGQLNFFKWAIEKKILNYIGEHLKEIDEDMNKFAKYNSKKKDSKKKSKTKKKSKRKKRRELSKSASKKMIIHNCPTTINFD